MAGFQSREEIKFYLPNGDSLIAAYLTRIGRDTLYQFQCIGKTAVLRGFVNSQIIYEPYRKELLGMLDLEPQNPVFILSAVTRKRTLRGNNAYELTDYEVYALIRQSRALYGRAVPCYDCEGKFSRRGRPTPFTECIGTGRPGKPLTDSCANCEWTGRGCITEYEEDRDSEESSDTEMTVSDSEEGSGSEEGSDSEKTVVVPDN
ncbi:hypothetical protein LA080_007213 [Diaporthe eres]|uniref:Uncharacterized protein n=1 Tax=Diaporthe vaccinii TaxID=105482 RepID=A0ABR4EFN9_9PEZI|nr:hypothetical protein LA080_007213 [Diaporthe eres]